MPDIPSIDAQMERLRQQMQQVVNIPYQDTRQQQQELQQAYNQLAAQRQQLSAGTRSGSGSQTGAGDSQATAQRQADAARRQMLALGQGGIDRLSNDSTDKMIRQYLQNQMGAQTLDPNSTPFGGKVPEYSVQGYSAAGYTPTTGSAQSWQAAQMDAPQQIAGGGPWNDESRRAYMNDATSAAVAGESARNQLIRDAILQSGGNASDPSLAAAYAESLTQRNDAQAKARNQINMRATAENFGAQRQADLANQQANMAQSQFNSSNQQQANSSNAALAQQMGLANMGAQNQAGMFNAQNQTQANQYLAGAQNQAGMFNTQNQMQGRLADYNAGNQSRIYNQQQQYGAANQLAGYNNQRQGMLSGAEQNQINLLGQQRFSVPQAQQPQQPQMAFPSFQQFQSQPARSNVTYAPGYNQPMIQNRMGFAPSQTYGSGQTGATRGTGVQTTTSSFGPTQIGNPWGPGASVGTMQPAVNRYQTPGINPMGNLPQVPGIKQPINYTAMGY